MRIALVDPSLFTWPYDSELAAGLAANGHQVAVFGKVLPPGDPPPPRLVQHFYPRLAGGWAERLPRPLYLGAKGLGHVLGMRRLVRSLDAWRPDVVHLQWTPLPAVDRHFLSALRRLATLVLTVHDTTPFNNAPGTGLQRIGAIAILRRFEHLIVHTEGARRRLVAYGIDERRVAVVPHGLLHEIPGLETLPARPAEAPVEILQFGKLKPYKGIDVLLRAVAAMPEAARRRCRVRIVGASCMDHGPLLALARSLGLDDLVSFDLRFLGEDEMLAAFRRADVLAMPYREIDASGVLMTALAVGRPIVASRIGAFAETLEDGRHGLLVPPGDAAALARALTTLVEDAAGRRAMTEEVRRLRRAIPDWRTIAAMTEAVYRGNAFRAPLDAAAATASGRQ